MTGRILGMGLMIGVLAAMAVADVTPHDAILTSNATTTITCQYTGGALSAGDWRITPAKDTYHYRLYVPPGYDPQSKDRYGCLIVFSPTGDADPGTAGWWLRRERMFGVSLVEAKNGPTEPIMGNFLAAFDDVKSRVPIADGFIVMTGMSGGARCTSVAAALRPGCGGLILQGAGFAIINGRFSTSATKTNPGMAVYGIFGLEDFNAPEMPTLAKALNGKVPFRCAVFDGQHDYAPPADMAEGLDYIQRWIYLKKPIDLKAMDMYKTKFLEWRQEATNATGWVQYQWLEKAQLLAKARKLSADKDLKEPLDWVDKTLATLAKDQAIIDNLAARELYNKTRDTEDAAQVSQWKAAGLEKALRAVTEGYQEVKQKYAQTAYAARAKWRLALIQSEVTLYGFGFEPLTQ